MRLLFAATVAALLAIVFSGASSHAQAIYPIDRAEILAGARFDFKVEFARRAQEADIAVTLNGQNYLQVFGRPATFVAREDDKDQSALVLRDVSLPEPGTYRVRVTAGEEAREIAWTVYATGSRKARNVILFIGDGMSLAHRTAARLLSKRIVEGKALGKLAIDDMPHMALVATAGVDSIVTDSANSMSAYATGHKSSVNALGVYADRTADPFDDPKVETITSLVQRRLGLAVGVVTNAEIEDATPAAMVAHTRRRSEYDRIVEQFYAAQPDVIMGGGWANFLPKSADGSKREDEIDYLARFRDAGYALAATAGEMQAAAGAPATRRLLGLFHPGNMDGVLDRKFLKGGTVKRYPEQPDLTEQVGAALQVLSKNENGFLLMVESGLIDKYTHVLDMERAVYDTIMLDNAVKLARDWASARGDDTLILVAADHGHPVSLVGTIEDDMTHTPAGNLRERVRPSEYAGVPDYPAPDAEGYPSRIDVSRRLALFSAAFPDYYETFRPKLDGPNRPAIAGKAPGAAAVANERYNVPGAMLRAGNLPSPAFQDVHSGDDIILTADGPGSERVHGQIDNTEVFRIMVEALGLGQGDVRESH